MPTASTSGAATGVFVELDTHEMDLPVAQEVSHECMRTGKFAVL